MVHNRSVPTSTMLAHVTCEDIPAAVAWLEDALGFHEHFRYGDPIAGVQMSLGDAWIMLNTPRAERATPARLGRMTQSLTIVVADVDAAFARATAAGAPVVEDLNETEYGERQFVVADPDGHRWLIAQHVRDVAPDEWGAIPNTG
ncbi:MAG: hypothetical protein AVDCRST_MAG87-543 [uncultured Thermomicrobiales bacterium]|uniref:VOC domain-containing protein n=1 Tax=uncultured Thermomicrobiales bacterium TaxID=1645740 RepID=A0A6J4UF93_9BACT|nr:MAG: hypothetical protein AVDCRST_MAG87-543 [uncultured Thermomicrobiales bacterium]